MVDFRQPFASFEILRSKFLTIGVKMHEWTNPVAVM